MLLNLVMKVQVDFEVLSEDGFRLNPCGHDEEGVGCLPATGANDERE
jgi:hypothetical protein